MPTTKASPEPGWCLVSVDRLASRMPTWALSFPTPRSDFACTAIYATRANAKVSCKLRHSRRVCFISVLFHRPLVVVTRVANILFCVDPFTLQRVEVHSAVFWRNPFKSLCTYGMYTEYTVLDMEPVLDGQGHPIQVGKVG